MTLGRPGGMNEIAPMKPRVTTPVTPTMMLYMRRRDSHQVRMPTGVRRRAGSGNSTSLTSEVRAGSATSSMSVDMPHLKVLRAVKLALGPDAVFLVVPLDRLQHDLHGALALLPPGGLHPLPLEILVGREEVFDLAQHVLRDVGDVEELLL